ncbi:MAG: GNAT family N-acetyltransferase [Planctomycetota bacterium]
MIDSPPPVSIDLAPMRDDELALVAELNIQLQIDEAAAVVMTPDNAAARMRRWIDHEDHHALLARPAGQPTADPVGYLVYAEHHDDCNHGHNMLYIRQFLVRREHRRQGIGRAMMDAFHRQIAPPNTPIEMDVLLSNPTGHAFWNAVGFQDRFTRLRHEPTQTP